MNFKTNRFPSWGLAQGKSCWAVLAAAFLGCLSPVFAGGGPENVFLVVNSADEDSQTIANYFVDYRQIPTGSVFYVDWPNPPHETKLATFRERILEPTIKAITDRGLEQQIDYIIYSSGFPYRVDYEEDLAGVEKRWASITSLTYLSEFVLGSSGRRRLASATSNSYASKLKARETVVTRGFSRRYPLDLMGDRTDTQSEFGRKYYLSMMLGYTKGDGGNTLHEVLRYLILAERADGTKPKGTIYLVKQEDVRSKTRHRHFPLVVNELAKLGVKGEVIEGSKDPVNVLPRNKKDVMGAVVGYAKARWEDSGSEIQPGAIVDNLTSYGGRLAGGHSQVMLTHFLRNGAIASSGTVTEPLAILNKFPHPRMHVHYARGCSVAESFYQSVPQPYQLLMVGDPLCQPWAVPPEVNIGGIETKKQLSGVIEFTAAAKSKRGHDIRSLELYVDGKFVKRVLPGNPIKFDTSRVADGFHELVVIAIEDTPVETQGRAKVEFVSANVPQPVSDEPSAKLSNRVVIQGSLDPKNGVILRNSFPKPYVAVASPGAGEIRLYKGRELVGSTQGESGRIVVEASKLGSGPVYLQPVAFPRDRSRKPVLGQPIRANVQ